jgi:ATP-dependent RNA helicase DHX37/DHR1
VLRQLLASAFIDQVAVRKDLVSSSAHSGAQHATAKGVAYCAMDVDEDVFIHPSSLLAGRAPPDYIVFSEIMRTSRVWMKGLSCTCIAYSQFTHPSMAGLTVVNPAWLPALGKPALCTFSKPVKNMDGQLMVIPRFGPGWELPAIPAEKAT